MSSSLYIIDKIWVVIAIKEYKTCFHLQTRIAELMGQSNKKKDNSIFIAMTLQTFIFLKMSFENECLTNNDIKIFMIITILGIGFKSTSVYSMHVSRPVIKWSMSNPIRI